MTRKVKHIKNVMEILPIIGDEKPFEFEFFTGDENKKFDDTMAFQQIIQNF